MTKRWLVVWDERALKELKKIDISIERKKFNLSEPIKKIGVFKCKIRLFRDTDTGTSDVRFLPSIVGVSFE